MKCAAEMGSGVMIYMPSFIKIGSGIQRAHTHTQRVKNGGWVEHDETFAKPRGHHNIKFGNQCI
jgi:hypothetical protein